MLGLDYPGGPEVEKFSKLGDKNYFKFKWQVEKNKIDGPTKDCWLTTAVSQPYNLGSSI